MAAGGETSRAALTVAIRKLTHWDVPAVLAILQESPEAASWSRESLLQLASIECAAWVAVVTDARCTRTPPETGGVIAGFLIGRIAADEFEILNMAVSRAHRRTGIGSNLLKSALKFSRMEGSKRAYLEVRASNRPAIALYARHGFTECGRRARYYREPIEDAVLLSIYLRCTR